MAEVGVYQVPGQQGGFLTPLLLIVLTVFGSHRGGAVSPTDMSDLAFDAMNGRIHEIRQVHTIEYSDAPPEAVEYSEA